MKSINLFLTVFLLVILNTNYASHCDDEDYTRDQKEAQITKPDSFAVLRK
ncbi:hypothetical protein [Flavobacterium pectinovorum]|jgi:hypothetical protein|nr:hypothetical protein [Flavobacterium pectinovorum]